MQLMANYRCVMVLSTYKNLIIDNSLSLYTPSEEMPAAGRTNRSYCFTEIDRKHRQVVAFTNSGPAVGNALEAVDFKTEERHLQEIENCCRGSPDIRAGIQHIAGSPSESSHGGLLLAGETILARSSSRQKLLDLFRAGMCQCGNICEPF